MIFSFLRKDKANDEPGDKPAESQQYPEAHTKIEKVERPKESKVVQSKPIDGLAPDNENNSRDNEAEPGKSEKPWLFSFLRKKKNNNNNASEDAEEGDEAQSYPTPFKAPEETTRPKVNEDASSENEFSYNSLPRGKSCDLPDEQDKPSGGDSPRILSFLPNIKDDPRDNRQPYPEAHTTREESTRSKETEDSPEVFKEPESIGGSVHDKPTRRPSTYSFRSKEADQDGKDSPKDGHAAVAGVSNVLRPNNDSANVPESGVVKRLRRPFQRKGKVREQECAPNDVEPNELPALHEDETYPDLHRPTARDTIDRPFSPVSYPDYDKGFAVDALGRLSPPDSAEDCDSGKGMLRLTNGDDHQLVPSDAECFALQLINDGSVDRRVRKEANDSASIGAQLQLVLVTADLEWSQQELEVTKSEAVKLENQPAQVFATKSDRASMKKTSRENQPDVSHPGATTNQEKNIPSVSSPRKPKQKKAKAPRNISTTSTPSVIVPLLDDEPPTTTEINSSDKGNQKAKIKPPLVIHETQSIKKEAAAVSEAPLSLSLSPSPDTVKVPALEVIPNAEPFNAPTLNRLQMVDPVHSPPEKVAPMVEPIRTSQSPPPPPPPPPPSPPTPPKPIRIALTEERRKKCYMWYARLGQPNRETMKRKVKALPDSCDITLDEVDALPWVGGGMCLSVKAMNELFLNPEDAD
jgi:hypothetical protein